MEITQKKAGVKHTFSFHDTYVNLFTVESDGSTDDIDVDYANIPRKTTIFVERNEWLRVMGYLWIFFGIVEVAYAVVMYVYANEDPHVGVLFWLGVACLAIYRFRQIRFTVFKTAQGRLMVMNDKEHDSIVEELGSRRKARILALYRDIDFDRDPEDEIYKYNWLVEEEVMPQCDADVYIDRVRRFSLDRNTQDGDTIN